MEPGQHLYRTTLANASSVRRAAQRLNLPQSPLTVAIGKLEDKLGTPQSPAS